MRRRWSPISKLFVVAAVACGLGAFAIVRSYAARLESVAPDVGEHVRVVVAATALARGTSLARPLLEETLVPARFAPPGRFPEAERLLGATLLTDVAAGEPLTRTRLADAAVGRVAALVPPGLRAMTIESALPRGAVRPGDHVDVLATYGGERPHSETVASALEVLLVTGSSAGGGVQGATSPMPSVVVLVAPDVAERLAYAKAFGELDLSISGGPDEIPSGVTEPG